MSSILSTSQKFFAGGASKLHLRWSEITSDAWVLNTVKGVSIPFSKLPVQNKVIDSTLSDLPRIIFLEKPSTSC